MSRKEEYERRLESLVVPILEEYGFELVETEFVKEGGTWYLRSYIDKPGGISVNDCEVVSRTLSLKLDEEDFVEEAYVMEVSSPGLGRPLKTEKDYVRSMGQELEIRTYTYIEKSKEFYGILQVYDDATVTIQMEDEKSMTFNKKDIALIRLAVHF
ncbi:MAG: ribosome maturation factor RimP [Lachnospiraceae bacterium]